MGVWVVSTFWLWIVFLWSFVSTFLWEHLFSFLLYIPLKMEFLDCLVTIFNILGTLRVFSKANTFYFPTRNAYDFWFFHIFTNIYFFYYYYGILRGLKWYFTAVFICISLMPNEKSWQEYTKKIFTTQIITMVWSLT